MLREAQTAVEIRGDRSTLIRFAIVCGTRRDATSSLTSLATNWEEETYVVATRHNGINYFVAFPIALMAQPVPAPASLQELCADRIQRIQRACTWFSAFIENCFIDYLCRDRFLGQRRARVETQCNKCNHKIYAVKSGLVYMYSHQVCTCKRVYNVSRLHIHV